MITFPQMDLPPEEHRRVRASVVAAATVGERRRSRFVVPVAALAAAAVIGAASLVAWQWDPAAPAPAMPAPTSTASACPREGEAAGQGSGITLPGSVAGYHEGVTSTAVDNSCTYDSQVIGVFARIAGGKDRVDALVTVYKTEGVPQFAKDWPLERLPGSPGREPAYASGPENGSVVWQLDGDWFGMHAVGLSAEELTAFSEALVPPVAKIDWGAPEAQGFTRIDGELGWETRKTVTRTWTTVYTGDVDCAGCELTITVDENALVRGLGQLPVPARRVKVGGRAAWVSDHALVMKLINGNVLVITEKGRRNTNLVALADSLL